MIEESPLTALLAYMARPSHCPEEFAAPFLFNTARLQIEMSL